MRLMTPNMCYREEMAQSQDCGNTRGSDRLTIAMGLLPQQYPFSEKVRLLRNSSI